MLMTMKELLNVAYKHNFAIGAFNIGSAEILRLVIEAAEEENSPVILEIHPDELEFLGDDFVEYCKVASYHANVPIVIHLDHGANLQQVVRAIKCGFTSVMIDASHYPYDQNVELTKEVVRIAHNVGVSVEAELGTIGAISGNFEAGDVSEVIYTNPAQATKFIEETGIDSLAIAIGTAHGIYPKDFKPELKIELLKEITELTNIPLVLHGGSSNPDGEVSEAAQSGVCKINISSDMKLSYAQKLKEVLNTKEGILEPFAMFEEPIKESKEVVKRKMRLFGSTGKANLY
jgi:fructose-bisphosphate aldolase class II